MTEREQKDLRGYCAFMLKEYGFDFAPTDPVIPALYVIHRELQRHSQSNDRVAAEIGNVTGKMKSRIYNFNSPGEGWKFQIALSLKWLFLGLSLNLLLWISLVAWQSQNEIVKAQQIIEAAPYVNTSLLNLVKHDKDGFIYLEFQQASGDSVKFFTEYDKVNSKIVRVYLGRHK